MSARPKKHDEQSQFFKSIFEFEDPSGSLVAAKIPQNGSLDVYRGSKLIVRPGQMAVFVYKGQMTDVFGPGLHELQTDNLPILTRLANWQFKFESPLRCDIWFFSTSVFTARKWGTRSAPIADLPGAAVPVRAFGHFNLQLRQPSMALASLVGSRSLYDVTELDEFVQGTISELLPKALAGVGLRAISDINTKQVEIATLLERLTNEQIASYGIEVIDLRVIGVQLPQEMQEALEARLAMNVIGNQEEFLMYRAAKGMGKENGSGSAQDPLHLMMGLILGNKLLGKEGTQAPSYEVAR